VSKIAFLFLLSGLQIISYVIIGNLILEIHSLTLEYWIMLFTAAFFANMLGLNISSGLNSEIAIYVLIPILLIPQILFSGTVVNFDKMHGKLTPELYPPFIADITTSRWAYEALAVKQFKENNFGRYFYSVEKQESEYSYLVNYYIPELISYLDFSQTCYMNGNLDHPQLPSRLKTLRNELSSMKNENHMPDMTSLNVEKINMQTIQAFKDYLVRIRKSYARELDRTLYQKDSLITALEKNELEGTDVASLKRMHQNEALARLVKRKGSAENILVKNNQLYRKYEPIYKEPIPGNGRAQFYSPEKRIGGWSLDTYIFNLVVIWFFIVVLYIASYYDVLKKGITYLSKEKSGYSV